MGSGDRAVDRLFLQARSLGAGVAADQPYELGLILSAAVDMHEEGDGLSRPDNGFVRVGHRGGQRDGHATSGSWPVRLFQRMQKTAHSQSSIRS